MQSLSLSFAAVSFSFYAGLWEELNVNQLSQEHDGVPTGEHVELLKHSNC